MIVAESTITERVNTFYEQMPFNYGRDAGHFATALRQGNPLPQSYPNLHTVLDGAGRISVADIGCGTGWFANCVAFHYRLSTTGIDFCRAALDRAAEIARELAVDDRITLIRQDIFTLQPETLYDVVNTLGVLHHTADCQAALQAVCALVKPGGYLHLGLYHKYGREPFLSLFAELRDKLAAGGEVSRSEKQAAYATFRALNSQVSDELLLRSWFRDQVLHPHETQHTLREVHQWLAEFRFDIRSTSINKFQPISNVEALYEEEKACRELSVENNIRRKTYYPGFFTVLAQKK